MEFSKRIYTSSPGAPCFKRGRFNSQDIYETFLLYGYLEKRRDKYGNDPHYFPTAKGLQLGITIADRSQPKNTAYGKMQISVFGEMAQRFFIQNCLNGVLK